MPRSACIGTFSVATLFVCAAMAASPAQAQWLERFFGQRNSCGPCAGGLCTDGSCRHSPGAYGYPVYPAHPALPGHAPAQAPVVDPETGRIAPPGGDELIDPGTGQRIDPGTGQAIEPGAGQEPSFQPPSVMDQAPAMTPTAAPLAATSFAQSIGGGGAVSVANTYIDVAQVFTHFRLRYDAAYDNPVPDRAEFFYAKCGCFGTPDANGPPLPESGVDYQDIAAYLEVAATPNIAGFVELPVRFLNPEINENTAGLADLNAGVKAVLLTNGEDYLTFQFKVYSPSGDASRGLGTDHASLEPGLLFYEQFTDRASVYGETRFWIPVDGSDFAGEVVRYGLGTGYDLVDGRNGAGRFTALAEFVGWTVVDGMLFNGGQFLALGGPNNPAAGAIATQDATGDTIVNLKLGARYTRGQGSFAASWGHALTGDVWYDDIFRLEYRRAF